MPRPTIEYLNARRALKPASGGKICSRKVKYAPDDVRLHQCLAVFAELRLIGCFLSYTAIAGRLGWISVNGKPLKTRVFLAFKRLKNQRPKVVKKLRNGHWKLTDEGWRRSAHELARHFNISQTAIDAIHEWRRVPAAGIIQIETITGVPREVLWPDLYEGWERAQ